MFLIVMPRTWDRPRDNYVRESKSTVQTLEKRTDLFP